MRNNKLKCSFCDKRREQVRKLIAGPGVYICNECSYRCAEIAEEELGPKEEVKFEDIPKPKKTHSILDDYIVGQERAKVSLSVAVYNHYKRINSNGKINNVEVQKSNIAMIGPTGSGKTFLAQRLAEVLNVPFAIADANSLTQAGYVGEDVENILLRLIQSANGDIAKAEKGIIYIDEIDKIARKPKNTSFAGDPSREGVQQSLLKIIEGTVANVPKQGGRKNTDSEFLQIDTTNILFICGGAFNGIENIIKDRLSKQPNASGFDLEINNLGKGHYFSKMLPEDLVNFGLIPEFIGRLPVITTLDLLDEKALVDILTKPKNALVTQYKALMSMDNIDLMFQPEALKAIAKKAIERKAGARGLRSIVEKLMIPIMYELPSRDNIKSCVIYKENVNDGKPPMVKNNKGQWLHL